MKNFRRICPGCKKELDPNHVQMGGWHVGCYEKIIDVYFVCLPHSPKSGYFEKDLRIIMEMLKDSDIDDQYLIQRKKVSAGWFNELPDFEGF